MHSTQTSRGGPETWAGLLGGWMGRAGDWAEGVYGLPGGGGVRGMTGEEVERVLFRL